MKRQAQYVSICPECGQKITPGTLIEYAKGEKARHVVCPNVQDVSVGGCDAPATEKQIEFLELMINELLTTAPYLRGKLHDVRSTLDSLTREHASAWIRELTAYRDVIRQSRVRDGDALATPTQVSYLTRLLQSVSVRDDISVEELEEIHDALTTKSATQAFVQSWIERLTFARDF